MKKQRIYRTFGEFTNESSWFDQTKFKTSNSLSFEEYLEAEAQGQRIAGLTEDHQEGIQAFIEKRKPIFIGN